MSLYETRYSYTNRDTCRLMAYINTYKMTLLLDAFYLDFSKTFLSIQDFVEGLHIDYIV